MYAGVRWDIGGQVMGRAARVKGKEAFCLSCPTCSALLGM